MECLRNSTLFLHSVSKGCPNTVVCLLETIAIIALTYLVVIVNLGHLIVLLRSTSLHNCHGYLIISLSLSDFMSGLVTALSIYPSATFSESCWPYGEAVCAVAAYISNIAWLNSILTLTFLSIERYIAAAFPLRYSLVVTKRTTLAAIVIGWLINAASQTTIFAGIPGYAYVPDLYTCFPRYFESPTYAAVIIFGITMPCFIVNVASSCIVRWKLAQSARRRDQMTVHTTTLPGKGATKTRREAGSDKLARMVRIMTTVLVLSWMPFFIVSISSVFGGLYIPQPLMFGVYWLLLFNGFLNALIFYGMNETFRNANHKCCVSLIPQVCFTLEARESQLFQTYCVCVRHRRAEDVSVSVYATDVQPQNGTELQKVQGKMNQNA